MNAPALSPIVAAATLLRVRAERARRRLSEFVRQGWHVLEPGTPLVWTWPMQVICDHIQAVLEEWAAARKEGRRHRFQNVVVSVPPGSGKSRLISVFTVAWWWLHHPDWRVICLSANPRVAIRDSIYCRDVVRSDWYQQTFRPLWKTSSEGAESVLDWELTKDQDAKSLFKNTKGGFRMALGVGAKVTGDRADALLVDDPDDAQHVHSSAAREAVHRWWDSAAGNRLNDLRYGVRLGIQQRLHEADWTGHILASGQWHQVVMQQEFEPGFAKPTFLGWSDPRTVPGELLFPERFPAAVLEAEKVRLGAAGYAAQHQQRPTPAGGRTFKSSWWRFWRLAHWDCPEEYKDRCVVLPEVFDDVIQSWDMAFKDHDDSDFVVGQVWAKKAADRFLLDQDRGRMDAPKSAAAVERMTVKWPAARRKLVEGKANGPAVIQMLRNKVSGLIEVEPEGGKEARAAGMAPAVESGNYYLPLPTQRPWVKDFLAEADAFPGGANDDQIDTATQADAHFNKSPSLRFTQQPGQYGARRM